MIIDLQSIYNTYFQKPYTISGTSEGTPLPVFDSISSKSDDSYTKMGTQVKVVSELLGREVFLPVTLKVSDSIKITIDCCTIRATSQKTIIRTAVSEREGTVKEQFNIGDWVFDIKGVLIGKDGKLPDDQIDLLNQIYKSTLSVDIENALADLLLGASVRVIVNEPEITGPNGSSMKHIPFTLKVESDFVETLTLK